MYPSYHRNNEDDDEEGGERNDFIKKPPAEESSSKEQTLPNAIDEDEIDDYARQLGASSTFFCPVSLELLKDPVVVRTGQTYERSSVEDWIQRGGKTCPATGQPLAEANESIVRMAPNFALRSAIQEWAKRTCPEILNEKGDVRGLKGSPVVGMTEMRLVSSAELRDIESSTAPPVIGFDKAKKMLNFCYTQIPYQYFDMGLSFYKQKLFSKALLNFKKAEQTADPSLILEIDSYKRDIANFMIEEVNKNIDYQTFSQSLKKLNEARKISPYLWSETDKIEAKILLKKGNILNDLNNYSVAIDFYQQALELDPSLFIEINDIYTELIIKILNDINDTNNVNELILVKDYLETIIELKPKYKNTFNKFIMTIENKLKNYTSTLTKLNLKEYVELKRKRVIESLSNEIKVGMSFYEVELILGQPNSIVEDLDYDLWIYEKSEKSEKTFKTYFFKDNILVKIN